MTAIRIIVAIIIWMIGIGIIDKNAHGEPFKHNELMGCIGFMCATAIPVCLLIPILT